MASADTWVEAAKPDTAHGSERRLITRLTQIGGARILVAFDLSALRGVHIISGEFHLTLESASGAEEIEMAVAGLPSPWDEQTSWNNQPERTRSYNIQRVGSTPGLVTWDVAALLRGTLEAGALHGIALSGPIAGGQVYERTFSSRENGASAPRLAIEYTPEADDEPTPAGPSPESAPTPAESPTATKLKDREVNADADSDLVRNAAIEVLGTLAVGIGALAIMRQKRRAKEARYRR